MATLEQFTAIYSSHQAYLERLAAGMGNDALPYIESINDRVMKIFNNLPKKRLSDEQQKAIRKEVNEIVKEELGEMVSAMKLSQKQLGGYEAEWNDEQINAEIESDINTVVPSMTQVSAAAIATPIKVGDGRYTTYGKMFSDYTRNQAERIDGIVLNGFVNGQTNRDVAALVEQELPTWKGGVESQARTLARTGTNHYATQARITYEQENDKVIIGWRSIATLDSRTSNQCASLDGVVMKSTDPKFGKFKTPRHPNAILKGEMVTTSKGLVAIEDVCVGDYVLTHTNRYMRVNTVMCKNNDTKTLRIVCNNFSGVSLTNDHPVLTLEGWKTAGDIKIGDVLFYNPEKLTNPDISSISLVEDAVLLNSHNIKTKATNELVSYGVFSSSAGVSSSINLNGGVSDAKVSYVFPPNNLLEFEFNSEVIEDINDDGFVKSWILCKVTHTRGDHFSFSVDIVNGIVSLHSLATSFVSLLEGINIYSTPMIVASGLWCKLLTSINRVFLVSGFDSELYAPLSNCIIGESIFSLYKSEAFSLGNVLNFDESSNIFVTDVFHNRSFYCTTVTSIVDLDYNECVYNISIAEDETYICNGILVHNCRSSIVPEIDGRLKYDDSSAQRPTNFTVDGKKEPKRVSSKKTYYEEIKKLSASDQDAILGPSLGKAFRKMDNPDVFAKQTINQATLEPLTLEQMRKKDNQLGRILRAQES